MTGAKTIGNRQLAARARDLAAQAVIRVYPLTEPIGEHLICRYLSAVQRCPDQFVGWDDGHALVHTRPPGVGSRSPGWLPRWLPETASLHGCLVACCHRRVSVLTGESGLDAGLPIRRLTPAACVNHPGAISSSLCQASN